MKLWLTSIINGEEVVNEYEYDKGWNVDNEIRKLQK